MRPGSATRKLHLACAALTAAGLVGASAGLPAGSPEIDQRLGTADGLGDARLYRLPPVVYSPSIADGRLGQQGQLAEPSFLQSTYNSEATYISEIYGTPAPGGPAGATPGNPADGLAVRPAGHAADGLPDGAQAIGGPGTAGVEAGTDAGATLLVPPDAGPALEGGEVPAGTAGEEEPVKLWSGSFELGLDGTEGNSQTFNIRFGFDAKRASPFTILSLDLDYNKKISDGEETANKLLFDWRLERLFQDAPWTCHVHGTAEYDEYQAYDLRWTVDLGVGYRLLDTQRTSLAARAGLGFAQEVGLPADEPDDENAVEAVFGLEFSHELSERQKLSASAEYTPEVVDFADGRITTKAAWEVLLDQSWNLKLKLQARNRYDSTPRGKKHNDLDYAAMLMWSF